jgi:Uma2 family endonuclease
MTIATAPDSTQTLAPNHEPSTGLRPYRISTEVYERIAASGALGREAARVFLWDGQLVEKVADMTKGNAHVFVLGELDQILTKLVPEDYFVEQDHPLDLGGNRVPEPDLKIVRVRRREFRERKRMPTTADVALLVEVADSSLAADLGVMLRAYAAAGVGTYWVANIPANRIEVYSNPSGPSASPGYADQRHFGPGQSVPVVLDGREVGQIAVDDVLR